MIEIDAYDENAEQDLQHAIERGEHVRLNGNKTLFSEKLKAIHAQHSDKAAQVILGHYKELDLALANAQQAHFEAIANADRVYYIWLGTFDETKAG